MPNNRDDSNTNSQDSMSSTGREFEGHGQSPGSEGGQDGGSSGGYGKDTGAQGADDEDLNTAGGREGQFSDSNRGSKGQWSPGSSNPTDE